MNLMVIASGNPHKAEEFAQLLGKSDLEVSSAAVCGGMPAVEENGETFAENAQLKAEALRKVAPEGAWILADDSGLEVDALGGEPGIFSARYAGPGASDADNLQKLLNAMTEVPPDERAARFRCALCLIAPDGGVHRFEGSCDGRISGGSSGSSGFGYDPVFVPSGYDQSFAELGDAIKGRLSHRARAVEALLRARPFA